MSSHTVPFIINGEEVYAEKTFDVVGPASGKTLHRCGIATEKEATAAAEAAAAAGNEWKATTPARRRDILLKAAEIMERRRPELAQTMVDEIGGKPGWADFNLNVAIDMIKDVAGRVITITGTVPILADPNVSSMVVKEPYGVVLAMAAW
jgi:acyl-CoA reductase-like NAD-dependent aldehyde dehydrogenase